MQSISIDALKPPSNQTIRMPARPVLIADDYPLLLMLLEHRLTAAGHTVVTAPDGLAAWGMIPALRPSLVILDSMMPRMGGIEVLRRIRADPLLAPTRVFMLTALRHEDDVVNALMLGAEDYLTKPFNPDELTARIARWTHGAVA